ncbi:MAG: biopolymer transporter ExbD [Planctomycetes bacterium]|nr:biopolymer transporter ExbD [Planctomycetota bacterium]
MNFLDEVREPVRLDMTPMIDCVFLMIIFFVCIDFRVLEAKLPAFLPKDVGSRTTVVLPKENLVVRIHPATPGTPVYRDGANPTGLDPTTKRPWRFQLEGHTVRWEVGPRPCPDAISLAAELRRIATDPQSLVPDPATGTTKLLPVVLEGLPGTYYQDLAATTDMVHAAGFREIQFGASGWR